MALDDKTKFPRTRVLLPHGPPAAARKDGGLVMNKSRKFATTEETMAAATLETAELEAACVADPDNVENRIGSRRR